MKKKKIIPNCKLCKWIFINGNSWCSAQGYKESDIVYNNKLCKILYEPKEVINEPTKSKPTG